jgi:hypothetical protein
LGLVSEDACQFLIFALVIPVGDVGNNFNSLDVLSPVVVSLVSSL